MTGQRWFDAIAAGYAVLNSVTVLLLGIAVLRHLVRSR